jgi:hypothetical protein
VNESQRFLLPQYVDPDERSGCLRGGLRVQTCQLGGQAGVGVVAEDRDGSRKCRGLGRKPRESKRDGARPGAGLERSEPRDVRPDGHKSLDGNCVYELAQEERIATGLFLAGSAESIVGNGRKRLSKEPGRGLAAQRSRPDHGRQGVGGDLVEQARVLAGFRWPEAHDDRDGEPLDARQQVRQPAQRGEIAPMQIVDRQ